MRLLVTMVAGLLSVLLGPSLAREGRARSVGSSMTLPTRCSSSGQKLWLCPWAVGRGVSGIIEWRAWGISFIVLSWVRLRVDGGRAARSCLDGGGLGVNVCRDHMCTLGHGVGAFGWFCFY